LPSISLIESFPSNEHYEDHFLDWPLVSTEHKATMNNGNYKNATQLFVTLFFLFELNMYLVNVPKFMHPRQKVHTPVNSQYLK
jgi:hypothetical protein